MKDKRSNEEMENVGKRSRTTEKMEDDTHQVMNMAQFLHASISEGDKNLITGLMHDNLKLIPDEDKVNVKSIFDALDQDNNNHLCSKDFQNNIPKVNEQLQDMWKAIINSFDFDGNGVVDFTEFMGFFIVHALYFAPAPTILADRNFCWQLAAWQTAFLKSFRDKVEDFKVMLLVN